MKKVIQLVRDGHVGHAVYGRLIIDDRTFLTMETIEGLLPAGTYGVEVGPQGGVFLDGSYPLLDTPVGQYSAAGLRVGLHFSNKGWDLTDKVTITNFVKSEIQCAEDVSFKVSYRKYDGESTKGRGKGKKDGADA